MNSNIGHSDQHLSDQALLDPTSEQKAHLDSCSQCHQRQLNLLAIQAHLNDFQPAVARVVKFNSIKHQIERSNTSSLTLSKTFSSKHLVPIAASFFIVTVSFIWATKQNEVSKFESELAELVRTNDQLATRLEKQLSNQLRTAQIPDSLVVKLENVDKKIQQAYLEKSEQAELRRLWQSRIEVMSELLNYNNEKPHLFI